jgi:hypothetical protein
MLLSSILQILDRFQEHPQPNDKEKIEPFEIEMAAAVEMAFGPEEAESQITSVEEAPMRSTAQPESPALMPNMEEWIRAISKFDKPEERVVDVFE